MELKSNFFSFFVASEDEQIEEVVRQLCLEIGPKQFLREISKVNEW
jgi:hypothetical protein